MNARPQALGTEGEPIPYSCRMEAGIENRCQGTAAVVRPGLHAQMHQFDYRENLLLN